MRTRITHENNALRTLAVIVFALYLIALCSLLLLKWLPIPGIFPGSPGLFLNLRSYQVNLQPFKSIDLFWKVKDDELSRMLVWKNIFGNILVLFPYAPLAALSVKKMRPWIILLSGLSLILLIELIQLITGLGVWDIDDVLLNTTGLLLGFIFLLPRLLRRDPEKKQIG